MGQDIVKSTSAFVFPCGLLLLIAVGFLRPGGLPLWCQSAAAALPYIALGFGLLFGWYFSSTRMLLTLVILAFANQALLAFPLTDTGSVGQTVFSASAVLLPVNFLGLSILKEGGEGAIRLAICLLLIFIQPLLIMWLCQPAHQELAVLLQTSQLAGWSTSWTPIPQTALIAFVIAGIMHVARFALRRHPMDAGGAWALGAVFLAYHCSQFGWNATHYFSSAALIVFVSLVQASFQTTYRDELTGVSGRLAYEEATAQLPAKFALAVVAIDQLKSYAGTHGKPVVDQILKTIAPRIQAACQGGRVFHVSGEEFTLLFPHQSAMEALVALDGVRKTIESASLLLRSCDRVVDYTRGAKSRRSKEQVIPVTVSIGVAEPSGEASLDLVIKTAYRALYEAKSGGGNAVKRGAVMHQSIRRSTGRIVATSDY